MPALAAVTVQVYVPTLLVPAGPEVVAQFEMPATPVIAQMPVAVGVTALAGPETVAVNVMVAPRAAVADPSLTAIVGMTPVTRVGLPVVGATL